jgi:hypothetical protein
MIRRIRFLAPALAAALLLATGTAGAQGKGAGKPKAAEAGAPGQKKIPPGQAKKVTTDQAVVVARDVLTNNGYRVVRVERVDGAQVIWYRRGNMGNGNGQGPLEKMVVRPASSIVKLEMTGSAAELGRTIGERLGIW